MENKFRSKKYSTRYLSNDNLSQSQVKKLFLELTEIKRPQNKLKTNMHKQSDTLPKSRSSSELKILRSSLRNRSTTIVTNHRSKEKYRDLPEVKPIVGSSERNHHKQTKDKIINIDKKSTKSVFLPPPSPPRFIRNDSFLFRHRLSSCNNDNLPQEIVQDEDFGVNEFDKDCDDNYVVEAYNDEGRELIIVYISIERKTFQLNDVNNGEFKELFDNSDMILHEDSDNKSIEIIKGVDDIVENFHITLKSPHDSGIEKDQEYSSPRSTIYSETSTNSNSDLLRITDNEDLFDDTVIRQESVFDTQGNVRISRFFSLSDIPNTEQNNRNDKLAYIIDEMIKTEEQYVAGLEKIVKEYKPYIERNSSVLMSRRIPMLFGNIDDIYKGAREFLELLKQKPDIDGIINAIIISRSMFELYPKYSKNKPTADRVLKEFEYLIKKKQRELGDRLDVTSYLLTPIQRLGKYILILDNLRKELDKLQINKPNLTTALEIIRRQMKKGNDYIAIDSIKHCPIDLLKQGSCLLREKFNLIKPRKLESVVFFFENLIVFTQIIPKNQEVFSYFASIPMNELSIAPLENEPLVFHLWDYTKVKKGLGSNYTYVLEAKTPKIKRQWTEAIEKRLWEQLELARQLQKQQHDKQGTRFSSSVTPRKYQERDQRKTQSLKRTTSIFYHNYA